MIERHIYMRMKMYKWMLRVIRLFGIEEKTIHLLKATEASDVKVGAMYEHYGRVLVAEKNPSPNEEGCKDCALEQLALPCVQGCCFRCRFRLIDVRKQYATNQKQWARMMVRRITRGLQP